MSTALAKTLEPPDLTHENWLTGLDHREAAFVLAYVTTLDVKNSAISAGYEPTTATTLAYGWTSKNLCTKPRVLAAVEFGIAQRAAEQLVTADMVIRKLKAIAFTDVRKIAEWRSHIVTERDEVDGEDGTITVREIVSNTVTLRSWDEIDDETAMAIKEIKQNADGTVTIKLHDARAAAVDLARYLGIMDVGIRHKGFDGGPLKSITVHTTPSEAAQAYRDMLGEDGQGG